MNQRRVMFLMLCFFGYVLLMAAWWMSSRNPGKFPDVKVRLQPFAGATAEFSSQLEISLHNAPGVELAPDGAILSGTVQGTQDVKVNAQLKNPVTGEQFWSKAYQASLAEPRPIPQEVAHDAIEAVRKRLR